MCEQDDGVPLTLDASMKHLKCQSSATLSSVSVPEVSKFLLKICIAMGQRLQSFVKNYPFQSSNIKTGNRRIVQSGSDREMGSLSAKHLKMQQRCAFDLLPLANWRV